IRGQDRNYFSGPALRQNSVIGSWTRLTLVVQRRLLLAREPGGEVFDVLLGKLPGEAFHDGVVAPAVLVVGERAHEVVLVLAGEHRLIGRRGLVAIGAVTGGAHLRRLLLAFRG